MAAPGEGKIHDAVMEKPGASGMQKGMETDLEKKKAEQAPAREAVLSAGSAASPLTRSSSPFEFRINIALLDHRR